jgi:hypothetical protein
MPRFEQLALTEGNRDFAWAAAFLSGRDDLGTGARFADAEPDRLPASEEHPRRPARASATRPLEIRVEQRRRPSETWSVFVAEKGPGRGPRCTKRLSRLLRNGVVERSRRADSNRGPLHYE